jgi:hypothetical protein
MSKHPMSKLLAVGAAIGLALTIGFSSTPSSAQAKQCGGFFGIPCDAGYVCRVRPHCADCLGVCVRAPAARRHSMRKDHK